MTALIRMADGTALAVSDWGSGPVIVLVHAWSLDSRQWSHQVPALVAAGFRVVTFDRRGHGRSSAPGKGYDLDTLADDLAAVMEQLHLNDVILVGHSMGGSEAVRYLGRHGSAWVRRLVLLAPTTPCFIQSDCNPAGVPRALVEQVRGQIQADFPAWAEDGARAFFRPDTSDAMLRWGVQMMLETPVAVALACNIAMSEADLRPDLAVIDIPSLVIQGDADASAPLDLTGRPTAALLRDARLQVIPGGPHGLIVTDAEEVNRQIVDFAAA